MTLPKQDIWTVSQVTRRVKTLLESEVGQVWVSGEISNWRVSPSGHAYFTLKDPDSQLDAVIFKARLARVQFEPDSGLEVICHGLLSVYERRGAYQIVVDEMHPKGVGALQLAFEKLKKKLQDEGLFDEAHKKPLPVLPRRIGIVTSPTGAAIRDMLNVIGRRFAGVHILLYPARVQGDEAAPEIVAGIRALDAMKVDVIIIGRGGGSLEDLWPFNEEQVVRAVYEAHTPIISAVGHEVDFSLSDFAADLRAPTPSAAAELVVREQEALCRQVDERRERLTKAIGRTLERLRHRLAVAQSSYALRRPEELLRERRQATDEVRMRLRDAIDEMVDQRRRRADTARQALLLLSPTAQVARARQRLSDLARRVPAAGIGCVERKRATLRPVLARLDALSPLAVLSRGYALVRRLPDREVVRSVRQLTRDSAIEVMLGEGTAFARVERLEEQEHG